MSAKRRVLLVSYIFPPVGGAGVQRAAKFVKYLPGAGWQASVLTASNPSVPVYDQSLFDELPPDTCVVKARSWEPGYAVKKAVAGEGGMAGRRRASLRSAVKSSARRLANLVLQPDPQILWRSNAVRAGVKLLRKTRHEAIVATGPPFSSFLVGAAISRGTGVPLVLDYRDEWDLSNSYWENKRLDRLSLSIQKRMQQRVLRQAVAVIATSRPSARSLTEICRQAGGNASVTCIYNGYDPDDFAGQPPPSSVANDQYRLAYIGTLWNLTTVSPLVDALRRLDAERPDLTRRLELVFAGRRTPAEENHLNRLAGLRCRVVRHAYLDHHEAIDLMQAANGLCVLLADLPGAERVVPAKIFEYMASDRDVFAIAPRGELEQLVSDYPQAFFAAPTDVPAICRQLARAIEGNRGRSATNGGDFKLERYSRARQAGELAAILNRAARPDQSVAAAAEAVCAQA